MNYDVFISYEHSSQGIAERIVSSFEQQGIMCWYAPRDVIGDYATSIVNAIENTTVFVLILNGLASNSAHVLNEVEIAYKKSVTQAKGISIVPFKIANDEISRGMEYYIKRIHWIDSTLYGFESAIEILKEKVIQILSIESENKDHKTTKRMKNKYFINEDTKEIQRLNTQQKLLSSFEKNIYERISREYENLHVLDLGTNCGDLFYDRFSTLPNMVKGIGIEYDMQTVEAANNNYGSDLFKFYQGDVEEEQFSANLEKICLYENIKEFEVINISMLLLHIQKPFNLLKLVRKFLSKDGTLIIKDIDDGFNVVYPDENNIFSKMIDYCAKSEFSGHRYSGREIYPALKRTGFRNITLENLGLSTVGLDFEQREALFDTYFSFIEDDYRRMASKYPNDDKIQKSYEWIQRHYEQLENEFVDSELFFVLGFILFTAKK